MSLDTITAAELASMDLEPPKQIIEGLFTAGLNILAGTPKSGKSFLALGLSLAVSNGTPALNKIPTNQTGVLYLALEDTPFRLKHRIRALNQQSPTNLAFATGSQRLSEGGADDIHEYLHHHPNTGMVVIDTLQKIADPKTGGNVYEEDYASAGMLHALAHHYQIALVIVHHTRKAGSTDFLQAVSGSSGITGSADTVSVLSRNRNESEATLQTTGRDIRESKTELTWYSLGGGWLAKGFERQALRGAA